MTYEHVQTLLGRYKNLRSPDKTIKKECVRSIVEVCGIKLSPGDIEIRNRALYLAVSPNAKQSIFRNKEAVLKKLKSLCGESAPIKIVL